MPIAQKALKLMRANLIGDVQHAAIQLASPTSDLIHGKGLNNKEGVAPLKRLVQKLIINCDIAMASTSAGIKDGGYGATYVLLKSSYI